MEMTGDGVEFFRRAAVVRRHGSYPKRRERERCGILSRVKRSDGEEGGVLKGKGGVNAERTRLFTSLDATRVV
jgi:hypothetical protein